ncbi:MAG: DUF1501 domain-containing protein, partial [Planctomycetaceae bacterium]|nr:DUF1501 domain-containing protein [Planctomycetaceae bacterium]
MDPVFEYERNLTRRTLLGRSARGIGSAALASLLQPELFNGSVQAETTIPEGVQKIAPKAKRIIYLFQSGGPSHVDLFDYKPVLRKLHGSDLPDSVKGTQRVTGMTAGQKSFPVVAPFWEMKQCGEHQTWISERLPYTQTIADDITIIKSVHTEAINHDPAITFINTGSQQIGYASLGSWLSYGLGSE